MARTTTNLCKVRIYMYKGHLQCFRMNRTTSLKKKIYQ